MKRLSSLVVATTIIVLLASIPERLEGQSNRPIAFTGYLVKTDSDPFRFKDLTASIEIMVKDTALDVIYTETHEVTLNSLAGFGIEIGKGQNQNPPWNSLNPRAAPALICYKATITDRGGDIVIMGESHVSAVMQANLAVLATSADHALALGNLPWVGDNAAPDPDGTEFINYDVLIADLSGEQPVINRLPLDAFFGFETGPSAVNQEPVEYFIKNDITTRPIMFGNFEVQEVENFHTYCFPQQENLFNGVGFKFKDAGSPLTHPTAAVYTENIFDPQGVGLFANGRSRGIYSQAQTGVLGICNNIIGNGAGLWGYIGFEPADGNFNYAVLASTNGFPDTYAAYLQGNVIYTGTLTGPSDQALKTETRNLAPGLETIMKLRPASYQYRTDVPYGLPAGTHYGFIAQEMEEVIPDLVNDIPMIAHTGSMQPEIGDVTSYKGINYLELIPVLTKAIQDLNTKVDAQAEEIKALRQELKACSKPK